MRVKLSYLFPLALCAPLTAPLADTNEDMEVIVVTAAGYEQAIADAPASITVITRAQLEQKFYRDVLDALIDAPGVTLTGGGDSQDISIRGMGSQYTLILIDGKRQSSRETRTNSDSGGVERGWTPPISAIERIEIIRGPMSSLYGSDAIGGVVNIVTRQVPEQWTGELRLDGILQESNESGDEYQGGFFFTGPLINNVLGLQLHGQHTNRSEDNIINGYRGREANNINARLAYTPNSDHTIALEARSVTQTLDNTLGKTVEPIPPGEDCGRFGCPESSTTKYESTSVSLSHTGLWEFGTTDSYIKFDEFENRSRQMSIRNTDAQTRLMMPIGTSHYTSFGASYFYEDLEDMTGNQLDTGLTEVDRWQGAVFAENEWRIVDSFALTGGLRYDYNERYGSHVSPRLYGVWHLHQDVSLKGGISTGFRAPNLRQTVNGWGQVSRGGDMYGNPDLEAEESINYEISLLINPWVATSFSMTAFYSEFDNKINRVRCPETLCTGGPNQFGADPTTYVNVDEAITQGFEVTADHRISAQLNVSAQYTFTESEQKTGEYAGSPLTQLPRHQVNASLNWQPTQQLNSWVRLNHRGRESQPTTGPSSSSLIAPSYTFVDLGGGYRLNDSVQLRAGLYNLLDKEVDYDTYGYIEDGRRLWAGLTVSF